MSTLIERRNTSEPEDRAGILTAAWAGIAAGLGALHRAWTARQAAISMWNLGPEMLRDIGIDACEIDWAVRHGRTPRYVVRRDDHVR